MAKRYYEDFASFWPFYVSQHMKPATRALHVVGTTAGLVALGLLVLLAGTFPMNLLFVPAGLVVGYLLAWIGHFVVERNRPATFIYPLMSFAGDFKMLWLTYTGRMGKEVASVQRMLDEGWTSEANRLAPPVGRKDAVDA